MRKRVKAFVEQPYIITDEGHLDVLFKILMTGMCVVRYCSVMYQLMDIRAQNELSIEQTWYVFKQTCLFAQNVQIRKKHTNKEKLQQ